MTRTRSPLRRGYTLLEVIIVLAILVILAGVTIPLIDSMYTDVKVEAAADLVRARWAEARSRAIEEGRPYRFAIRAPNMVEMKVAPDTSEFWSDSVNEPGDRDDSPVFSLEEKLPKDVRFVWNGPSFTAGLPSDSADAPMSDSSSRADGWTRIVTFYPDGTCSEDVELTLASPGTRSVRLRLRALTGSVSLSKGDVDRGDTP